jgi:DNA-binding IclR family transcriptional regulator
MRQLTRALDILELLGTRGQVSLAELSVALEQPRASTHRLLTTLETRGYVHHDVGARSYRLGPAIRSLAARTAESSLVRIAEPVLAQLTASTGESVNLGVLVGARIVYGATLDGALQPRMSAAVGEEVAPHATALGKAILASLTEHDRTRLLPSPPYPRYTPSTLVTPEALGAQLELVRAQGFAVEIEESTLGAVCVAAPILDATGSPIGGLSISGITARLPEEARLAVAALLRDRCARIAVQLADGARAEGVAS